jgi:IS30 family transposase
MHHHISARQRELLAVWKAQGDSNKTIARRFGCHPSTIGRELRRNRISGQYVAITAQAIAVDRSRQARRRHPLKNPDVYTYVLEKLRAGWSPQLITGRLREVDHPGDARWHLHWETIYRFVYQDENQEKYLWENLPRGQKHRRKKHGRSVQKARIPQRVSIHQRPAIIGARAEFGHWEGDTIEGRRSEGDGIHTEVERQTRFLLAKKVNQIASPETIRIQLEMFRGIPDTARQSTTLDNGRENHRHLALRFLGMRTYFCDPYSSWQRGTNENTNGLVRRYFPKGSSFRDLSQEDLEDIVAEINDRPKRCLGYHTPAEVFERLSGVAIPSRM